MAPIKTKPRLPSSSNGRGSLAVTQTVADFSLEGRLGDRVALVLVAVALILVALILVALSKLPEPFRAAVARAIIRD